MRRTVSIGWCGAIVLVAVGAVLAGGCASAAPKGTWQASTCGCPEDPYARPLDPRADWLVGAHTDVREVLEEQPGAPARRIGLLVGRDYRRASRGGMHRIWQVTTLDRGNVIGQVDELGRATRFESRGRGEWESVDLGISSLENGVAAIFGTSARIVLQPVSERRLAFESLDANGNGLLEAAEIPAHVVGDRIAGADRNGDGVVDFAEFDALDRL